MKKVRRLEKSTPLPVVALVTNVSFDDDDDVDDNDDDDDDGDDVVVR